MVEESNASRRGLFHETTMSRTAKATLATAVTFCSVTIFAVHYMQRQEREVGAKFRTRSTCSSFFLAFTQTMYQGVLRDDARRLEKHKQREEALQESLRKRELYERVQTVSSPGPLPPSTSLTEDGRR